MTRKGTKEWRVDSSQPKGEHEPLKIEVLTPTTLGMLTNEALPTNKNISVVCNPYNGKTVSTDGISRDMEGDILTRNLRSIKANRLPILDFKR